MTTAYTNIRVETIKSEGKAFDFWVCANRGSDRVILTRVGWQAGSFCHVTTETEAKCWADLFADALRLKRENDKLRQENAELRGALEFYADPDSYFAIFITPDRPAGAFADDFSEDHGGDYNRSMPGKLAREALCATQGNSLPAVSLGGSVGRLSADKPITAYPRIRDLPVSEREPFAAWLIGQTVPMITDTTDGEQDAYYPWDYDNWKRKGPILD
jgi:hypothetical protein